jgi:hypothetical protein
LPSQPPAIDKTRKKKRKTKGNELLADRLPVEWDNSIPRRENLQLIFAQETQESTREEPGSHSQYTLIVCRVPFISGVTQHSEIICTEIHE